MGDNRLEHFRFIERIIRESLGNPVGCNIWEHNNTYTIKPQDEQGEVQVNAFYDNIDINGDTFYLLRTCNLIFDHCVFACEIRAEGELDTNGETIPIDNKINFHNCTFQKPISFLYTTFNNDIVFQYAIFEDVAYFDSDFNSRTDFIRCKFKSETYFKKSTFSEHVDMRNSTFQYIDMKEVEFKKEANFSDCKFQTEADFSKTTFSQKADFTRTIFRASAYFDNAIFGNNADFERSEFCENAHFYQANFSRDPNFFQAMFNERLNLTDAKIHKENTNISDVPIFNFDFEQLRERVQACSDADKFRDVFKNIKNALIKSGNLLGASRFRKMELYCKEIELDLKRMENGEASTRDFIDKIQLYCYRVTSDHHTDLLLTLNNVIVLIACFGFTNLILNILFNRNYFDFSIQKVFMAIGAFLVSAIFIFSTLFLILNCWKGFSLSIDWFKNKLQVFKTLKDSLHTKANSRTYLVLTSYCLMAIIFAANPSLFLPILGQLLDNNLYIGFTFASLNIAYAILMFLLIWSLQKTARKNTIVPN